MTSTRDIVSKLWSLCDDLRDEGVSYLQYVTELTYLLFLKMAAEEGREETRGTVHVPEGRRWADLVGKDGLERLKFYRRMLIDLEDEGSPRIQKVYKNASTRINRPETLSKLVAQIDEIEWFSTEREQIGDLYEGLLEKMAAEAPKGAGQYFTPRPLIDTMVDLTDPEPGEVVQDPAAGTGGFIISADRHIKDETDELFDLPADEARFQREDAFRGVELVDETHRLGLMNMLLHDIECDYRRGNTLSQAGSGMTPADVILTNPPFGVSGGNVTRDDFTYPTNNKQLAFLQHIYRGLKPGGRAAVVAPDNVLFEDNTGQKIRTDLMNKCNLHTILRLPTGIFYARGVKTNVMFFTRGESDQDETDAVWIYDMRTNSRTYGKRNPLTHDDFEGFTDAWGDDIDAPWEGDFSGRTETWDAEEDEPKDETEGRWRRYSREEIRERGDNLDVTWLHDDDVERVEDLPPPEDLAGEIMGNLQAAMDEMEGLMEVLEEADVSDDVDETRDAAE